MYRKESPTRLVNVQFEPPRNTSSSGSEAQIAQGSSGVEETPSDNPRERPRGLIATRSIEEWEFLFELGGLVSIDEWDESCTRVSIINHEAGARVLVGPIRFINHSTNPNCGVRIRLFLPLNEADAFHRSWLLKLPVRNPSPTCPAP